ncbi:hypothetical protein [Streptomyces sp. NBC_01373]|uniref:hypothetical protein n=1 Tax=Streptomyces sp. NBC_01373 TaxID=2903843 RepID=UPI00224F507D|nr:hypothetical protein [Streptomyces sp. NBC_01373]MCX4698996.1 hypothetical protein [Streptomyces sp. NBC_01373]
MEKNKLRASQHEDHKKFTLIGALFPLVGVVLGILYLAKDGKLNKKLGEHTLAVSALSGIIWIFVLGSLGGGRGTSVPAYEEPVSVSENSQVVTPKVVEPKIYEGTGDDVVTIEKPAEGAAIVSFECAACTSNVMVKTNGAESLIVNTIGAYSGRHLIDVRSGGSTTQATIKATASWKLTVSGLDKATAVSGASVSGTGNDVLRVTGETTKAAVTNQGESNFIVSVYPEDGFSDLPINTIGAYKGTVPMESPAYVQITSSGNWSVMPQ